MKNQREYIVSLVTNDGPEPNQYEELNQWFQTVGRMVQTGNITRAQIREMWHTFGEAFSVNTMQGFVVNKPHGYAGDFEIIDKIYTGWLSPNPHLVKWDRFFHWQKAPVAVRNRKEYFKQLLSGIENSEITSPIILNIGSGPCRDIYEYQNQNPRTKITFECLDMDENAISYSKRLLNRANVTHYCHNAFKFKPEKKYDLVWSAGLFDYLDNKQFTYLFGSLFDMVSYNGELVIGNFSDSNPSRDYMEFGEWYLHHRNENQLSLLAEQSGCSPNSFTIDKEPSGLNLFVKARKL